MLSRLLIDAENFLLELAKQRLEKVSLRHEIMDRTKTNILRRILMAIIDIIVFEGLLNTMKLVRFISNSLMTVGCGWIVTRANFKSWVVLISAGEVPNIEPAFFELLEFRPDVNDADQVMTILKRQLYKTNLVQWHTALHKCDCVDQAQVLHKILLQEPKDNIIGVGNGKQ